MAFAYLSISILSAGRAYVNAEGLYSKGHKDAVYYLARYAQRRQEDDFKKYQEAIAIPLGDQQARLEMETGRPDLRRVRDGFLQAQNHPDDIDGMIMLFQRFRRIDYMAQAITIWARADAQINMLTSAADALRVEIRAPQPDEGRILGLLEAVNAINNQLTPLESDFSATLGEAQRKTQILLISGMFAIAALLLLIGVQLSRRIFRQDETVRHALRESAARFRSLTELSSDWYWEQDDQLRFTEISGRIPDKIKRSLLPSIGRTQWNLELPVQEGPAAAAHRERLAQHQPFDNFETRLRLDTDDVMIVSTSGEPKFDAVGRFTGYRGVARDITTTRHSDELRAAKEAAELASRSKSAFLARMSHELRTPLNAVLGFAQLLDYESSVKASPGVHKKVEHIRAAGSHLLTMVNEILDLSRIESGTSTFSIGSVEVGALLDECVMMTRPQADRRQIRIEFDANERAYWISGDRTRLMQIAINILSNAIKYNRDGGVVTVSVTASASPAASPAASEVEPGQIAISIKDTGIGLNASQQASLFQPFNRLGAESRVGGAEGTGLGLVIAKQLAEAMHGSIAVASMPGEGSTFTLTLPRANAPAAVPPGATAPLAPPRPQTVDAGSMPAVSVLYVEDNAANLELVRAILARRPQVRLECAIDGGAGLAAAFKLKPDLILLDINLPGFDGFDIIRTLRAHADCAAIPCMAVSANAMPADIKRAFDAGFAAYVVKPINVDDFLVKFDAVLDQFIAAKQRAMPVEASRLSS